MCESGLFTSGGDTGWVAHVEEIPFVTSRLDLRFRLSTRILILCSNTKAQLRVSLNRKLRPEVLRCSASKIFFDILYSYLYSPCTCACTRTSYEVD